MKRISMRMFDLIRLVWFDCLDLLCFTWMAQTTRYNGLDEVAHEDVNKGIRERLEISYVTFSEHEYLG